MKIFQLFFKPYRLLLVNAVYFKGHWRDTFDDANTTKETFYVNETTQKEVNYFCIKMFQS